MCLLAAALLLSLLSFSSALSPSPYHPLHAPNTTLYHWYRLKPAHDLHFHSCYEGFECARLLVPLDYENDTSRNEIALPVIRLPASVAYDHPDHGGAIIINPGGPGGSGILYALAVAEKIQNELNGPKQYDIVSFDPRGVFLSTPNAYCFDEALASESWYREKRAVGSLDSGEAALRHQWAFEQARGRLCERTENGVFEDGENIRSYVSTAFVARDMLEIVEKLEHEGRHSQRPLSSEQATLRDRHKAKLQYMGGSYGTFLGQTFASLYPERVGRMVLDANIDAENWISRYEASVDDHNAIRRYFFAQCLAAESACAFWKPTDRNREDLEGRYDEVRGRLQYEPAVIAGHGHATVISADELEMGFFTTSYQPLQFFKPFARLLNALYDGVESEYPFWENELPTSDTFKDEVLGYVLQNAEVSAAIHCSDGPDLSDEELSSFKAYLANLTERFSHAGAIQGEFKIPCWTWPASLRTRRRYSGPFGGDVPILFLNNRLDPATPAKSAMKMASKFNGSSVLIRDAAGHGAMWPVTACVWDNIRAYMDTGEMPEHNSICEFDCRPFADFCEP